MKQEKEFKPGEILNYTGIGFIGFRKNETEVEFVRYDGLADAYIKYDGKNVLVRKHYLERTKAKRQKRTA